MSCVSCDFPRTTADEQRDHRSTMDMSSSSSRLQSRSPAVPPASPTAAPFHLVFVMVLRIFCVRHSLTKIVSETHIFDLV